jgi:integrase
VGRRCNIYDAVKALTRALAVELARIRVNANRPGVVRMEMRGGTPMTDGLRHTMATLILQQTKGIKLVAARLGHANEYLVLRRYGHLLPAEVDREAADQLRESLQRVRREARITQGSHAPQEDPDR